AATSSATSTKDAAKKDATKNASTDTDEDATADDDATDTDSTETSKDDQDGWHSLTAQDGLFDSLHESAVGILVLSEKDLKGLEGKPVQIELRAHDAAGNV